MLRAGMLVLLLSIFPTTSFASPEAVPSLRLSYLFASRGGYVFPGSDAAKVSNFGLAAGKAFGDSGRSYAIRPYGLEVEYRIPWEGSFFLTPVMRLVPMGLQLPGAAEQDGWDGFLSLSLSFLPEVSAGNRLGFDLGLRARRWQLESGPLPSTSHLGLIVATRYETEFWEATLEAGLMAMGIGNPTSIGVQRDSSTLRARWGYRLGVGGMEISPWLEFFHTHRSFYGATVLAGESSLFIDEAALLIGISFRP